MDDGLRIITLPGGYYPYVLVGWVERQHGDEYRLLGARCIKNFGPNRTLSGLADHGPWPETRLLDADRPFEEFHRLQVGRSIPCDEKAWAKHCPPPKSEK